MEKMLTNCKGNKANFPNVNIPNIPNLLGSRGPRSIRTLKPTSRPKRRMRSSPINSGIPSRERELCINSKMRSKPAIGQDITCRGSSQSNRTSQKKIPTRTLIFIKLELTSRGRRNSHDLRRQRHALNQPIGHLKFPWPER